MLPEGSKGHFGEGSECVCCGKVGGGWLWADRWAREGTVRAAGGEVRGAMPELESGLTTTLWAVRQDVEGTGQRPGTHCSESVSSGLGFNNRKQ